MSRLPGAEWRPLPESGRQGSFTKTQLIVHSIVGSAEGAYGYFLNSTDLESTFIVKKSGKTIQVLDSAERADANFTANERAMSAETEDNGDPNTDPWTAEQVAELIRIGVWAHQVHGIPVRRCPAHDKPGFGYHSMFGAPSPWTPVRGKTCPGVVRIRQFDEVVLPGIVAAVAALNAPDVQEDDDMKPYLAQATGTGVFIIFPSAGRSAGLPTQPELSDARRIYGDTIERVSVGFLRVHGAAV